MQLPEIDTQAYSSLPDKRLYLALLFSIFGHGLLIVLGFFWMFDSSPATYQTPSNSSQYFEVSLFSTSDAQNHSIESELKSENSLFETEYAKVSIPENVRENNQQMATLRVSPSASSIEKGPSKGYKKPSPEPVTTKNSFAPLLLKETALSDSEFEEISLQLDQLRDKLAVEDGHDQWELAGQKYTIDIEHIPAEKNTGMDKARVEITTVIDGVEMSTTLRLKRLAFSNYVQIINRWDPEIVFSQDVIDGRFHSNSRIHVARGKRHEPTFKGKVSVSSSVSAQSQNAKNRIFQGGLETGVKKIQFPKELLGALPEDVNLILKLAKDSNITFLPNGDYEWYLLGEPNNVFLSPSSGLTRYIFGGKNTKISVKGIVKGSVVIHAMEKITIAGNLIYAEPPEAFPNSTDYLGLISEKYIEVESPKITGRGDIAIHAAILAKRRFVIKNPRTRSHALLTIMGSLTAGSISVSEPRFQRY